MASKSRSAQQAAQKSKAAARAERAAQARREQESRERKRRLLMFGSVGVALLLIVGAVFLALRGGSSEPSSDVPAAGSEYGVTIGGAGAPHEIVIYEDFLCPFCGALEEATRDDLDELATDGQVQVEYRPFVLLSQAGDYSARATNAFAVVLDASGAEVAKTFHDLLYENQPPETGPFPSDDDLVDLAVEAGAEEAEVADGITGLAQQDFVDAATQNAADEGIQSTPTIYLDGEPFSEGSTVEELAANLISAVE